MASNTTLERARYAPERSARDAIDADDAMQPHLAWARNIHGVDSMRRQLLADAVRVQPGLLPDLSKSLDDVRSRAGFNVELETFVMPSPSLNAAVIPAKNRMMVLLSSAIIESLDRGELDFVVGHELGHAAFGHLDIPALALVAERDQLAPRQRMQLMAWNRQAEISADRAGLLCCGDVNIAATAMFRVMSGLVSSEIKMDPNAFAEQWKELARELRSDGRGGEWHATHPFPPLRMKAMLSYSRIDGYSDDSGRPDPASVDAEIERMLGMIDPLARRAGDAPSADGAVTTVSEGFADPMLRDFFFFGGLAVAAADGSIEEAETKQLAELIGQGPLDDEFARIEEVDRSNPATIIEVDWVDRFQKAIGERRRSLSAMELRRIFTGLAAIAKAGGRIDDREIEVLGTLAKASGIAPSYIETLL